MSAQVECPKCGGYKVFSFPYYVDRISRKRISESKAPGCVLAIGTTIAAVIPFAYVVAFVVIRFFPDAASNPQNSASAGYTAAFIGMFLAVIAGIVVYRFFVTKKKEKLARAIKMLSSTCELCGYSWEWPDGQPRTDITVRPDLIRKGEQNLEARRLEEKRRQDAMAGWYMQQQRDKNQ